MKCSQCDNNCFALVGKEQVPLCLNCYEQFQRVIHSNVQMLREEINHASDSMAASWGLPVGPRYPVKRPVVVAGGPIVNNHISVSGSEIGVLNLGTIKELNQAIDSFNSTGQTDLARAVTEFANAIKSDAGIAEDSKEEILESLNFLTKEAQKKDGEKSSALSRSLIKKIPRLLEVSANALTIWGNLQPLISGALGL